MLRNNNFETIQSMTIGDMKRKKSAKFHKVPQFSELLSMYLEQQKDNFKIPERIQYKALQSLELGRDVLGPSLEESHRRREQINKYYIMHPPPHGLQRGPPGPRGEQGQPGERGERGSEGGRRGGGGGRRRRAGARQRPGAEPLRGRTSRGHWKSMQIQCKTHARFK